MGSNPFTASKTSDIATTLTKGFLDIQSTIECRFNLERVRDVIITYSQCTVQISIHNTVESFGYFG